MSKKKKKPSEGSMEEAFAKWAKEFPETTREEVKYMGPPDWRPWLKEFAQMVGVELDAIRHETYDE